MHPSHTTRLQSFAQLLCALLVTASAAGTAAAQDVLTVGSVTAPPTGAVTIPIYLRDTAGTLLGVDQPAGSRISAIAFKVTYGPVACVTASALLDGPANGLLGTFMASTPCSPTRMTPSSPGVSQSYLLSVPEGGADPCGAVPFTGSAPLPGDQLAELRLNLSGCPVGAVIPLHLETTGTSEAVLSSDNNVLETVANGSLSTVDGQVTVIAQPDLALAVATAPSPVAVGGILTYTLSVTNLGGAAATGVTVLDTLPGLSVFNAASASQGTCSGTGPVSCTLGTIAAAASATMTVSVLVTATGTLLNTASVALNESDPNPADNTATTATQVLAGRGGPIGVNTWTPLGPDGGWPQALCADPQTPGTVYLGGAAGAGVWKTTDGGDHWVSISAGLPAETVAALAVRPGLSSTVFVVTSSRRVWRSTDGGLSWHPSSTGIPQGYASGSVFFAFEPGNPDTVLVSFPTLPSLFKSTDGGATWAAADGGLGAAVGFVSWVPTSPPAIFATVSGKGVMRSTDGAVTWQPANNGIPSYMSGGVEKWDVSNPAVDPGSPNVWYATTTRSPRLYRSENAGDSWVKVADTDMIFFRNLLVHPADHTLWAVRNRMDATPEVVRSTDGGIGWSGLSAGHRFSSGLAIDGSGLTAYAGLDEGLYRSSDLGQTWVNASRGLRAIRAESLAIAPSAPSTLWVGLGSGLLRTDDGGQSFSVLYPGPITPIGETVAIHPTNHLVVLTDAYLNCYECTESGLVRTTDGGATWTHAPNPLPPGNDGLNQVWGLAFDPSDPSAVYATGPENPSYQGQGIYKSVDGGATFAPSASGLPPTAGTWPYFIVAAPTTPTTVFLGTGSLKGAAPGVWRSRDAGGTWQLANTGLPANPDPRGLVVHPGNPNTLFMGVYSTTTSGLYGSTDGGDTWAPMGTGLPAEVPRTLAIDPVTPSTMYAGFISSASGVFRSTDGGASWVPLPGLEGFSVFTVAIDPANHEHLVAATRRGLYEILATVTDADGDGVDDAVENAAPNAGDGNGDGIPDAGQAGVTSLPLFAGGDVTLVAPAGSRFTGVRAEAPPAPLPPDTSAPVGTLRFGLKLPAAAQCGALTVYLPKVPTINGAGVFGPSPADLTPHWMEFRHDGTTGGVAVQEATRTRLDVALCDGGRGDGDLVPDGAVTIALVPARLPAMSGDTNGDGTLNAGDLFYLINFLFVGGAAPVGSGDVNGDGEVNVSDVFYLINFLFAGGPAPQ